MTTFPDQLLVKIVSEAGEEPFMIAGEKPSDLDVGLFEGPTQVARYILVGQGNVNTVSEYVETSHT